MLTNTDIRIRFPSQCHHLHIDTLNIITFITHGALNCQRRFKYHLQRTDSSLRLPVQHKIGGHKWWSPFQIMPFFLVDCPIQQGYRNSCIWIRLFQFSILNACARSCWMWNHGRLYSAGIQ